MNKTIQNKKIINIIPLYVLLIFILQLQVSAQNNTFYTMQDGKFYLNCEEAYPLFINYSVTPIEDINGEFHVSPTIQQCYCNTGCDPWWSCGKDKDGWRDEMIDHFYVMDTSLNFDVVRLLGIAGLHYDTATITLNTTGHYSQYDSTNPDCYLSHKEGIEMMDTSNYTHQGDLLQEVIDIIDSMNFNLKLLVSLGGGGVEKLHEKYTDYCAYMANRFRDEPVIFGYDLYNEPSYNTKISMEKYGAADTCFDWYDAIKQHAPAHFVTMGVHTHDVFRWDPEILPLDFISFHMYTKRYEWELTDTIPPEPYAYEPSENRYKAFLKWISLSFNKPVIMGETGLSAIDPAHVVPPNSPIYPEIESEANQKRFAEFVLKYTNWYGHIGFSWWKYKDTRWGEPNTILAIGYYHGLVYSEKYIISGIETLKPAADAFINYVHSTCDTCSGPDINVYLNPNSLTHTNPVFGEEIGLVSDGVQGVPNAYIEADVYNPYINIAVSSYAITNDNGEYKIYTHFDPDSVIVRKIACSYASGEFDKKKEWNNGLNSLPDFVLPALDPDSLPIIPNYVNWTIESDTTWENMQVPGPNNVIVKEGATLTIKSTVYFNANSKLVVQRGGKLIIDEDGVLTSNCNSALWKGVELRGNSSKDQSDNYQGMVVMSNGGTIENAVCGISTISYTTPEGDEGESPNYAFTGGIVIGDGGIFKNNRTAVKFWPYNSFTSLSVFRNCQFISNDDMLEGTDPGNFIEMSGISGIHILGGSFTDNHSVASPDELTSGIESYDSHFTIWTYNGPCVFTGLYDGIRAYSHDPENTVNIHSGQFSNNLRSVYLSSVMEATITGNEFNPWEGTVPEGEESYCLYLDYCTDYTIEENQFIFEGSEQTGIGLVINNSGPDNNEIYNNYFTNLRYATLAENNNRGQYYWEGLVIKCNEYIKNDYDIAVTALQEVQYPGIASNQGGPGETHQQAGNLFSLNDNGIKESDYSTFKDSPINYYHHKPEGEPRVKPIYISKYINLEEQDTEYDEELSCPPSESGGGSGGTIEDLREAMASSQYKADSTQAIHTALVDGGDSEVLEQEVLQSMPPETYDIYMSLMGKSPYLSDSVLIAAIEKENVLPNVLIKDILVANPQSAKSVDVMEKVDEKSNPLSQELLAEVLLGQYIVAAKEKLEANVAYFKHKRSTSLKFLKQLYRNDTVNSWAHDSLIYLLENESGLNEKYELVFAYASQDNWMAATNLLSELPAQYDMNQQQQQVYDEMQQFINVLDELHLADSSIYGMTDVQKATLYDLADYSQNIAGAYARGILIETDGYEYTEPIILPDAGLKSGNIVFDLPNIETFVPEHVKIYPNPALDYIIIELNTGNATGAVVSLFDNQGRTIRNVNIPAQQQHYVLGLKGVQAGMYVLNVDCDGKNIGSKKFSIIK